MLNAGIKILPFNGNQTWNAAEARFDGVDVEIRYPQGQDSTNNQPASGDYVFESSGKVWLVEGATVISGPANTFRLSLKAFEASERVDTNAPSYGMVQRGGIVTPQDGILAPFWDSVLVSVEVSRIAQLVNAKLGRGGNDASNITSGQLDKAVLPTLDIADINGLDSLLTSDDLSLDSVQELVDYIKVNRGNFDSLSTANVAGLDTALTSINDEITSLTTALAGKASTVDLNAKAPSVHGHMISNITGLQSALDDKLESSDIKTINGQSVVGSGDIEIITNPGDTVREEIEVTSFASLTYNASAGITLTKEYSDSSLKIEHNKGIHPASVQIINTESTPNTKVVFSATTNVQFDPAGNYVIVTNVNNFETMAISLLF